MLGRACVRGKKCAGRISCGALLFCPGWHHLTPGGVRVHHHHQQQQQQASSSSSAAPLAPSVLVVPSRCRRSAHQEEGLSRMPFSTCRTSWLIPPWNDADGVGAASSRSPLVRGSRKCNSAMRDIEKRRRVVADDSHHRGRGHLNQRSARLRSPQQQVQVEHVHLLMVIRLVVQQAEAATAAGVRAAEQSRT